MGDRVKWEYEGIVETDADRQLIFRREQVIRDYSLLRLHLTRFNWISSKSILRARSFVERWVGNQLELMAADAGILRVKSERYFRNLLEILPKWAAAPFAVVVTVSPSVAGKLRGLYPEALAELYGCPDTRAFHELFGTECEEFTPDLACSLVHFRKPRIGQIWTDWLKVDPPARLVRFWCWVMTEKPDEIVIEAISKHFDLTDINASWEAAKMLLAPSGRNDVDGAMASPDDAYDAVAEGADTEGVEAVRPFEDRLGEFIEGLRKGSVDIRSWENLVDVADADPSQRRKLVDTLERIQWGWKMPPVEQGRLRVPRVGRPTSITVLELMAAGPAGAVKILETFQGRKISEIVEWTSYPLRESLLLAVLAAVPRDDSGPVRLGSRLRRTASEFLKKYDGDIEADVLLIPRWKKLGNGPWRAVLLKSIGSWEAGDFDRFLGSSEIQEVAWGNMNVELREAILTRWVEAAEGSRALLDETANRLPDILKDAVRWGNFLPAVPYMLRSCDAKESVRHISRLSRVERNACLELAIPGLPEGVNHPVVESLLAKDRKLFALVLSGQTKSFRAADVSKFPLDDLLVAAIRYRWLVPAIERDFDEQTVSNVLKKISRSRKLPTRKRAAVELSAILGVRHLPILSFLSTRPLAEVQGTRFDKMYHSWMLPKRKGGKREISAPKPYLKAIQRALLDALFGNVPLHASATGFRKNHSIKDNALPHVGQPVVANVDIAGFFPNTSLRIVRYAISKAAPPQLSRHARNLIFDICTLKGGLPTGAPTSPAIANIGLISFDHAMHNVCTRHGIVYTRYADDLTFSGRDPGKVLPFVEECLEKLGYGLDRKKTNFFRRGRRQVVTGLVVNDKVSLPRTLRRRLRAAVHSLGVKGDGELHWHGKPMTAGELNGRVAFLNSVDPEQGAALLRKLKEPSSDE